jgi:superfamily II DNA helicase RecQ
MKLRFFSINALDPDADQAMLDTFCTQHRLVAIDKHFVTRSDVCYWSVCVTYLEKSTSPAISKPPQAINKRGQVDYREVLNDQDFAVYSKLRNLRKLISDAEGTPVYAIVSNDQMAAMVTNRVNSLTALGTINGIGDAKLGKYGKRFLEVLQTEWAGSQPHETHLHSTG